MRRTVQVIEDQVTLVVDGISHLIDQMEPHEVERVRVPAAMAAECLDEVLLRLHSVSRSHSRQHA